jgi:hypothetical protein
MSISLVEHLADPHPEKRRTALYQVLSSSERSESLCIAVVDRLSDSEGVIRELASEVLQDLVCNYPDLVPKLIAGLRDSSPIVRANILRVIQRMTTIPDTAMSILPKMLSDTSLLVRISAAHAVWKHLHISEPVIPVVLTGLSSNHRDTIIRAAQLAAEMAGYGDLLIDPLSRILAREDASIRGNILYALLQVDNDKQRLQQLASRFINDPDTLVRYTVSRIMRG